MGAIQHGGILLEDKRGAVQGGRMSAQGPTLLSQVAISVVGLHE